ncbi:MAG: hypothetical protein IKV46_04405 [Bacteroidales bacterium]|nr:hypothetical protein [Bacteroidales bacterium]
MKSNLIVRIFRRVIYPHLKGEFLCHFLRLKTKLIIIHGAIMVSKQ